MIKAYLYGCFTVALILTAANHHLQSRDNEYAPVAVRTDQITIFENGVYIIHAGYELAEDRTVVPVNYWSADND